MLQGYYVSPEGYRLNLIGYDFDSHIIFNGSAQTYKDRAFFDGGVEDEESGNIRATWDNLYFQVNLGDVKIDKLTTNSYVHNFNLQAFSRLGSIVRGMKSACVPQREESYNSMDLDSFVFGSKTIFKYSYKGNSCHLQEGSIYHLEFKGDGEEYLILNDVYSEPVQMLAKTKQRVKLSLDLEPFQDYSDLALQSMSSFFSTDLDSSDLLSLNEIMEAQPEKSYYWLKNRRYLIVNDLEQFKKIARRIYNHNGVLGVDTETTGLNVTFKSVSGNGDDLVGIVLSIRPTKKELKLLEDKPELKEHYLYADSWYIPLRHKKIENIVEPHKIAEFMEVYMKVLLELKQCCAHNGSFDAKVFFIYGILINLVHDTRVLIRLAYGAKDTLHSTALKDNVKKYLMRDSFELSDFDPSNYELVNGVRRKRAKSKKQKDLGFSFADLSYESVKYYACPDTDSMMSLLELGIQENWFDKFGMRRIYELEVKFTLVLAYQEFFGHHVNVELIESLRSNIEHDIDKYSKLIYEIAGYSLNLRSSPQLKKLLFEELDMPIVGYTDSGAPSADKDAMKKYMDMKNPDGTPKYPIAQYLQGYRDAVKLQSDFIKNIDKISTPDGFMFSSVNQFLETGRLSVSEPNYQSYSDTVKKYITPRKGYYMMDSDYSSVEIRIMMSMAKEKSMIDYLYDPDADYHTLKASQMFSIPYELVTKKQRGGAKGVNFGIVYGMGNESLGENITGKRDAASTAYGAKLRKLYFKGMDVTESFIQSNLDRAVENRYAETYFGRRRYFPDNLSVGNVKRQGGNHPIQGTAADLYKLAMVKLYETIIENDWWGKMLITAFVHDEVVIEAHNSINPAVALKTVRDSLMLKLDGWCPLYIGFGYGASWYNAKKTEVPVQVQNALIDEYGDIGYPFWNGDIDSLYAWEIQQIYNYKVKRILDYAKDHENKDKVIYPVISGFLYEVMGYVVDIQKLFKSIEDLKVSFSSLKEAYNSGDVQTYKDELENFKPKYLGVIKNKVSLDFLHLPNENVLFALDSSNFTSDDLLDYINDLEGTFLAKIEELNNYNFMDNLDLSHKVSIGGISQTLVEFGKSFGVSDVIEEANLQEPKEQAVDTSSEEVEYEPEGEEVDTYQFMEAYIRDFWFYKDYAGVLYLLNKNNQYTNFILSKMLDFGAVARKLNPERYVEVESLYESGNRDYFKVVFLDEDMSEKPVKLYLENKLISRVSSLVSQTRKTMNG